MSQPRMDDFRLHCPGSDESADSDEVWMQCGICLEAWVVVSLDDAIQRWNQHRCRRKT